MLRRIKRLQKGAKLIQHQIFGQAPPISSLNLQSELRSRTNNPIHVSNNANSIAGSKATAEEEDGEVKDLKAPAPDAQPTSAQEKDQGIAKTTAAQKDVNQKSALGAQKPDPPRPTSSRSSTPKPATPVASSAPSNRQDSSRPSTLAPAPGLPSRPEVPFPAHFTHDKFGTIRTTTHPREHRETRETRDPREVRDPVRDIRDTRDPRDQRTYRPIEESLPTRQRDHQHTDRRQPEPLPREPPRSERERQPQRPEPVRRNEQTVPNNDSRSRDRAPPGGQAGRGIETSRNQRDSSAGPRSMLPPPQPEPQGPPVNPDRLRMISGEERPEAINPARVPMIDTRPPGHQPRDDSRNRNSSRPPSPRPVDRPGSRASESSREDRPTTKPHRSDHHPRDHRNDAAPAPQTRGGRLADHGGDRPVADRPPRESVPFRGPPPASHIDSDDGRLSHQESNYGRLNAIPSVADGSAVPDGPRGRGRNMARGPPNTSTPDTRFQNNEPQRPRSPERHHPPTGPSSSRPRRGQPSGQFTHGGGHPASPAGTATTTPGIHPERLRQFTAGGPPTAPPPSSYPASTANSVPVHPDRMSHIGMPPGSSGSPHRGGRASLPPLQTPEKPSVLSGPPGQRQSSGTHSIPSGPDNNSPMSAPTGPAATTDRTTRTGGRRQLADINSTLQGGPATRGRNSRTNLAGSDAQVLTGASPISPQVYERPEPVLQGERGANGNERLGRHDTERGRRDHDNTERTSRPSRHGSRERSAGRERGLKDSREYRERKPSIGGLGHGGRESERELPRRSGREPSGLSRDPLANSSGRGDITNNGREGGRDGRHRGDGAGRHEEFGRSGGGGRGGPGGRNDHRESRKGDDRGGRKRPSEEGFGAAPSEKRQRR